MTFFILDDKVNYLISKKYKKHNIHLFTFYHHKIGNSIFNSKSDWKTRPRRVGWKILFTTEGYETKFTNKK